MLALERLRRALRLLLVDQVVPPDIPTDRPRHVLLGAADDEDLLDRLRLRDGVVGVLLESDRAPLAIAAVGGDEDLRLGVVDASGERFGREAAEDDRERRADASAREHRGGQLGDHRHIDRDPVPLLDAQLLQRVGTAAGHLEEVAVREGPRVAGLALPVVGDLGAAPGLHVTVEAVLGEVELTAEEPLRVRRLPLEDLVERLSPEELFRLLRPEPLEVTLRALVDTGVVGVRLGGEVGGRREPAVLLGEGLERRGALGVARHRFHPRPCLGARVCD